MPGKLDIDTLIRQARHGDASVREAAVHAMARVDDEQVQQIGPVLVALLADADRMVRNQAVEVIGILRYGPAVTGIEHLLLQDEDWVVRASAAETLGDIADACALDSLEAALADEVEPVRAYAALAIGLIGEGNRLPALRRRLAVDKAPGVRSELLVSAMRLGDDAAFDDFLVLADNIAEESIPGMTNAIEDLLSRKTPSVVNIRGTELGPLLEEFGRRSSLVTEQAARLRERLAEICPGG